MMNQLRVARAGGVVPHCLAFYSDAIHRARDARSRELGSTVEAGQVKRRCSSPSRPDPVPSKKRKAGAVSPSATKPAPQPEAGREGQQK